MPSIENVKTLLHLCCDRSIFGREKCAISPGFFENMPSFRLRLPKVPTQWSSNIALRGNIAPRSNIAVRIWKTHGNFMGPIPALISRCYITVIRQTAS